MAIVLFSHLGEVPIKGIKEEEIEGRTIGEVIANIEKKHPGFKEIIFKDESESEFDTSTRVIFRPIVGQDAIDAEVLFYGPDTVVIDSPSDSRVIASGDNVLFSILKPERFLCATPLTQT